MNEFIRQSPRKRVETIVAVCTEQTCISFPKKPTHCGISERYLRKMLLIDMMFSFQKYLKPK